jgi:hypothetical protein
MSNRVSSLPTPGPRCQDWLAAVGVHRMLLYALGDAVLGERCIILSRDRKRQLEEESEL